MALELTPEQRRAVERRDSSLLLRAGAGTGKTAVLVERFVAAVVEDRVPVDSVLAITFTEKAAGELKERIRKRFVELGERPFARDAESAWVSTIHGFCSRVLRTHALAAGVDPEYEVLSQLEAERLALDAFDRALERFVAGGAHPGRLELVAAYTPDRLGEMVRAAYSLLRSRGQPPLLPELEPRRPAGEREALESAVAGALAELQGSPSSARVEEALDKLGRCRDALAALAPEEAGDADDFAGFKVGRGAKALKTPAFEELERARDAYARHCLAQREYRDYTLLRDLLVLHDEEYSRQKEARSGLDFEDLELQARDLLEGQPALREAYARRFSHVMVDEFQDTNPLQNRILELIERDNLFRVGDEHQSIYRFRNADVGVFREHHRRAEERGSVEELTLNFRSRGEVLDAIDLAFERAFGDHRPLREVSESSGSFLRDREDPRAKPPRVDPCVELLVVDRYLDRWKQAFGVGEEEDGAGPVEPFGPAMRGAPLWRAAEARLLAKRIDELTRGGPYSYGDVAVLLRATTHMRHYERALEERGIPTYVVGGRGYWAQQQVTDLRHYLAALANPRDELAVHSVLASPLVGASLDALTIIGLRAKRQGRDVWWALEQAFCPDGDGSGGLAAALAVDDRERIGGFVRRFADERRDAPRISLETLIDRAVTTSGYDRAVLAMPAGERRMANVRKLMRLAREYEADEGRDVRGFIDFVGERDLIEEREGEAPVEAEGLERVRLMTVHRAKGLEFPVVCLGDLGKEGREEASALRITDDGRVGMRLASLGGGAVDSADLEAIRERQRLEDEAEEKRIFYVAMTRAQEHLLLSGATDLERLPEEKPLGVPMNWVWRALAPDLERLVAGGGGEAVDSYEGRPVRVRCVVCAPAELERALPPADREPTTVATDGAEELHRPPPAPERPAVEVPSALPVSRLSYSGLEDYKRCGYRFYVERALGLPAADDQRPSVHELDGGPAASAPAAGQQLSLTPGGEPAGREPAAGPDPGEELPALVRGSIVHELLERLDFGRPTAPERERVAELIEAHGEVASDQEVSRIRGLVEGFVRSSLCARLGAAERLRTELPFAFTLAPRGHGPRTLLLNGVVDVHARESEGTLIVDYKSDALGERSPGALCEEKYATQRLVYALAELRAGAERVEVLYCFLERPEEPVSVSYGSDESGRLEQALLELAAGVISGRFDPTPDPHRELCAGCPAQPSLCSWGPERTLAERAA